VLLPLHNPPPSSHRWESPTARATWGDVCSLTRRIVFEVMPKPVWNLLMPVGVLDLPLWSRVRHHRATLLPSREAV